MLEEDEGENGVRSKASVIWREAFPEREEALRAHDAQQHLLVDGVKRDRTEISNCEKCANVSKY